METIINGKVYDTDTAKFIGKSGNGRCKEYDFEWYSESLYQNKTGEFFLYGEGNYKSKYAKYFGECAGQKIIMLSYDAARHWAEEHLTDGEYTAIFGPVKEGC